MNKISDNAKYGLILVLCVLSIILLGYVKDNNDAKKQGKSLSFNDWVKSKVDRKLVNLIIGTTITLLVLGSASFHLFVKERNTEYSLENIKHWLNNTSELQENGEVLITQLTLVKILASMAFGVIFGFIDNAGLFFGMDALDPYVKKISSDSKVSAGIGNTYSDVIGAFAGSFAGSIVQQMLKSQLPYCFEGPLWAEATGIFLGCILGIVIPKAIVG